MATQTSAFNALTGVSVGSNANVVIDANSNAFLANVSANFANFSGNVSTTTLNTGLIAGPLGSGYVAAVAGAASVSYASQYIFGTSNFTIEFWINPTSLSAGTILTTGPAIQMLYNVDGTLGIAISSNGSAWNITDQGLNCTTTVGEWSHIALVRNGSSFKLYKDGVNTTRVSSALGIYNPATTISLVGTDFNGLISNYRIVIGTAVYTTDFTPPSTTLTSTQLANVNGYPSAAITGTQTKLLTFESSSISDISSYAASITSSGISMSTQTVPFGAAQGTLIYTGSTWQVTPITVFGNVDASYFVGIGVNVSSDINSLGNISASGNVSANKFLGNGSLLSNVLTVSQYTTGSFSNVISNVHGLTFDTTTGFTVTDIGGGNALIQLGSSFKTWQVAGQTSLVAVGEDTVQFVDGNNIVITTNASATPQQIKFSLSDNITLTGNIVSGGDSNLGNSVTANFFIGDGGLLSNVGGGSGNGTAIINGNSNVVVYANSNVATSVSGNANVVVVTGTGVNVAGTITTSGNANVGNLNIGSGVSGSLTGANVVSANYFIGNGALLTGITTTATALFNGNSSVIVYANGNVATSVTSTPNVLVVTTTGIATTGLNVTGNAIINGNLTVDGNTSYVNVEQLYITDPIIEMGGSANGSPLTTNDGKDRGTLLHYYTSTPLDAFMGWDNSNSEFIFGSNVSDTADVITVNEYGNIRANFFIGSGNTLSNIAGANVSGNVSYANYAYNVDGANVSGNVANANYATYAGTAYSVSGSNVSGEVANANYATYAGTAYSVSGSNVSGEVANANYATFAGTAYSVSGSNVSGEVANANYATYAGTAYSVSGSNVSGEVANANYATFAGTAYSVSGSNVSGEVANANYATYAGTAYSVSGSNVSGEVANANNSNYLNGISSTGIFNNMGQAHATYSDFDAPTNYGYQFIQGNTNGPANVGGVQYFTVASGLGSQFAYSDYAQQMSFPRLSQGGNAYLTVRQKEAGVWGAWTKIYAGIADEAYSVNVANVVGIGNIATLNLDGSNSNVLYGNGVFAPGGSGNGTAIVNGTSNVIVELDGNVSTSVAGNANVFVVTNIGANINGYANATYFVGDGGNISNITAGNITGEVANANYATYAGTVLTNAQPNITSVGILEGINSNGSINGNSSIYAGYYTDNQIGINTDPYQAGIEIGLQGRTTAGTPFIDFHSSNTGTDYDTRIIATGGAGVAGDGNLDIYAANFTLYSGIFYGDAGGLSNLTVTNISNGISNVNIDTVNGNVTTSVAGNANVVVVTGTGLDVSGTINTSGNANVGNINVGTGIGGSITGANTVIANYFIGNGSLLTGITTTVTSIVNGNSSVIVEANGNVSTSVAGNANVFVVSGNSASLTGNLYLPNTPTGIVSGTLGQTWTANFDGAGSFVTAPSGITSGSWTIEFWVNPSTVSGNHSMLSTTGVGYPYGLHFWLQNGLLMLDDSGTAQPTFSSIAADTWTHFALVRDSVTGITTVYKDGVVVQDTYTGLGTPGAFIIGNQTSVNWYFAGAMSNFRVVDGIQVYTAAFTPPTLLLEATQTANTNGNPSAAITGTETVLLTFENSTFVDNSSFNNTITPIGTMTTVNQTVPFAGSLQGTLLFNGSRWEISPALNVNGTITATNIGNISAINLDGSSANVLYGNGVFAPGGGGGGNGTAIVNGNSNVIVSANGNVSTSVAGNANIFVVTGIGANINGDLTVANISNLGNVGNVKITGGANGQILQTDGAGNLNWKTGSITVVGRSGNISIPLILS